MKWRIVFARTAERELAKLSSEMQLRVARAIRSLEDHPVPASAKRLKGREEFALELVITASSTQLSMNLAY